MKRICTLSLLVIATVLFTSLGANAATFTAVATGDWTSSTTWSGGIAPGTTINADDDIIITSGVTVFMDSDVTLNGFNILVPGGSITVDGTLESTNGSTLFMNNGDLAGSGSLMLDRLEFSGLSSFGFVGTADIDAFATTNLALSIVSSVNIADTLILDDGSLTLGTGGTVDMQTNSNVLVNNGNIVISGGIFSSVSSYNALYIGTSKNTGVEATGSGLANVTVNLDDNTQSLSLSADVTANGDFEIQSGNVDLNGSTLTLMADYTAASGTSLAGDAFSSLTIMSSSSLSSSLEFMSGSEELENLTIDFSGTGSASANLQTDLTINGMLSLNNGSLELDNTATLMMAANSEIMVEGGSMVNVNGIFDGSNNYELTYSGSTVMAGVEINGSGMTDLTIDLTGENESVDLSDDVTLNANIMLQNGNLDLNGQDLEIAGDFESTSTGQIEGDASSNLTISTMTSVSDTIWFAASANMLNDLTINVQDGGMVMIGSDVEVTSLTFTSGMVAIFDNDLVVNSTISNASSANYVATEGSGSLSMTISGATAGYVMYPVGTMSGYAPAHIESNLTLGGDYMVNVSEGVMANGTSGADVSATKSMVNKTWNITSSLGASSDINLKLNWDAAMEVNGFDRMNAYISHYTAGNWDVDATASATTTSSGMYELQRSNISGLSPFAVTDNNAALEVEENNMVDAIFPNPTNELTTVQLSGSEDRVIELIDMSGKVISTINSNGNTMVMLDLSEQPSGIYFVRVRSDQKSVVKKLIKS